MQKKITYKLECAIKKVKMLSEFYIKLAEKNAGVLGDKTIDDILQIKSKLEECEVIISG